MDQSLFAAIDQYIAERYALPDEALTAALQSLEAEDMPKIAVSPAQGKLLHVLALLCGARQILEIGTLSGYSTIWLARALPTDGRLISLEVNPKHADVARRNIAQAGLAERVEVRVGAALEMLPQLVAEVGRQFDMVFIDADKAPYSDYFQWSLQLTRPGGLIVGDNTLRRGAVLETASDEPSVVGIQRFNDLVAQSPAVSATILQTVGAKSHDGITLAVVTQ